MASLGVAGGLLLGCGISATTLQYYSRRYVGELALVTRHPSDTRLRFSVLDFWGNREVCPPPGRGLLGGVPGTGGGGDEVPIQSRKGPTTPRRINKCLKGTYSTGSETKCE